MSDSTANSSTLIFTDGAARGNPGPGGWGAVIVIGDDHVVELGGRAGHTTNNKMELSGAIEGLARISDVAGRVDVFTDSAYVVRGITQWIHGWRRKGWVTAADQPVLNRELWERLHQLVNARGRDNAVSWYHVPGHAGVPGNERCDVIATSYADGMPVDLYDGPLPQYPVAIRDIRRARVLDRPGTSTRRPAASPSSNGAAGKKAYSYLSLVGGKLQRHATWAECERRVRGVSGAKFKKAMSAAEEAAIIQSWGCPS